ncbi:FAD-binding protein [Clostridiales bacterium PH28_bin88]|nr:FAD-binding protein [Clostridiales bacterium PH28_bin88]
MKQEVISRMHQIMNKEQILTNLEDRMTYAYDGTMQTGVPGVVVFPRTTRQVAEALRLANREKIPVYPRGAGTGLSGGSVPEQGGIALVLTDMNRILEVDTGNLLAVVEPGVVTEALQQEVERVGLFYPPDPGSLKSCTIGGNIAENAGGPRALKYGVTRDYVLGLEVVTPTGEILRTGGKTVKNVTGYDLTRLMTGSEGTLGVVTRAVLRLIPRPQDVRTAMAVFATVDGAAEAVAEVSRRGILPTTLELMDDVTIRCVENYLHMGLPVDAGAILLIEVDGFRPAVDEAIITVEKVCRELGATGVEVAAGPAEREELWRARRAVSAAIVQLKPTKISEDATVPRSRVPEMVRRLKAIAQKYDLTMAIFGHAGDGNLHPNILADRRDPEEMARVELAVEELFRAAMELEGTLSGEHGIGSMKAPYLPLEVGETGMRVMRGIKAALDPNNILSPGKMLWG